VGSITARLLDELGYDPCDPRPEVEDLDLDAVPAGSLLAARAGARQVAVGRLASGRLVVVDDVCPHDGGRISDGFVDGEVVVCARHGWELDCTGPCPRRARPRP